MCGWLFVFVSHAPLSVLCRYVVLPHYKWTFDSYFESLVKEKQLPSEREVLLLLIQLCNALVHLQRHHVVHGDFKVSQLRRLGCNKLTHLLHNRLR